jgi:hypothetical protein
MSRDRALRSALSDKRGLALGGEVRWQNWRRAKHVLLATSEAKAGAPIGDEQEMHRKTSRDSKRETYPVQGIELDPQEKTTT